MQLLAPSRMVEKQTVGDSKKKIDQGIRKCKFKLFNKN